MAKKPKGAGVTTPLGNLIDTALARGQFPTALEYARKFVAEQPSEASRAKLRCVLLETTRWSLDKNAIPEAVTLLNEAERLSGDLNWWEQIAFLRVETTEYPRAVQLLELTKQDHLKPKLLNRLIDNSFKFGGAGKKLLPETLQEGFDTVLKAFQFYEQDRFEETRTSLQSIGLQSPFLEWKVLLRGLMAYSTKEDAKAIENWSRLDPTRLPAKLAEPLRLQIDPTFGNSLKPKQRDQLQRRSLLILGDNPAESLRDVARGIASGEQLSVHWTRLKSVHAELKKLDANLALRVQTVLYWSLMSAGPRDLDEFYRACGPHPADPQASRLRAMIMESIDGEMDKAHKFWKEYQDWIEKNPERWPSGQAARARAIIWSRMGENAIEVLEEIAEGGQETVRGIFSFLQGPRYSKPLKPGVEECFSKAMELAPTWVEPAAKLFDYLFEAEKYPEAEKLASDLVTRFPNDLPTLVAAEKIHTHLGRSAEALDYARRAYQTNPLDRKLRDLVAQAAFGHARSQLQTGAYDEVRQLLNEAASLSDSRQVGRVLCLSVLLEEKANRSEEAVELRKKLDQLPNARLATIYRFAVEAARVKLPTKRKKELEEPLKTILAEVHPLAELLPLMEAMVEFGQESVKYRGYLTHAKKIRGMVEALLRPGVKEDDLKQLGFQLLALKQWPTLLKLAELGMRSYSKNPHFPYFLAEYGAKNPNRLIRGQLQRGYQFAMEQIRKSPPNSYPDLEERLKRLLALDPRLGFYSGGNPFFNDYCDD